MLLLTLTAAYRSALPVAPADLPVVSFADASLSGSSVRYLPIVCNLVYEICALLCFCCRGSILQPDAEDGWQQRGLCDCAVCLCQNERSDKSSDRELALFQIYKRNTAYVS